MTTGAFETAYRKLNDAQREAVDTIDGPVMVVAGPGTGKTQILTLRIANILLKTDTPPEAILALTFTDSGVRAMKKRLVEIMGERAYRVQINTFHGFARKTLNDFPDYFPRFAGAVNVSPIEQLRILEEIVKREDLKLLRPYGDPLYFVSDIVRAISDCKRENIKPVECLKRIGEDEEDFKKREDLYHTKGAHKGKMKSEHIATEKHLRKAREFAVVYDAYEKEMVKRHLYDFDDMICGVVREMEENDNLKLQMQEACQYVLADEHQDANGVQNKFLELLTDFYESPNLFVVGDEKQAIFRFQGASLQNFEYFTKKYPLAKLIHLTDNYRSTQTILDSAHSLIDHASGPSVVRKKLLSKLDTVNSVKIEILQAPSEKDETREIVSMIKLLLDDGELPHEIAVLFRQNKDAERFAKESERQGIPFVVEANDDILREIVIARFISLLRGIVRLSDDEAVIRAMHCDFLGVDEYELYHAIVRAKSERKAFTDFVRGGTGDVRKCFEQLKKWKRLGENVSIGRAIEEIGNESGFLSKIVSEENAVDLLQYFGVLLHEAEKLSASHHDYRLSDFIEHLDSVADHGTGISSGTAHRVGSVRLMTAHKSKGLEFNHVFVVGLTDGHWGNKRAHEVFRLPGVGAAQGSDDDERRLLYVALTRARKKLTLSYAMSNENGDDMFPSMFLSEIEPSLISKTECVPHEISISDFVSPQKKNVLKDQTREYLREIFYEQGLSVTALNNYIKCPWRYFYSSLMRVPQAQDKTAAYGTAVHFALRKWVNARENSEHFDSDEFVKIFEQSALRSALSDKDLGEMIERGRENLPKYFEERSKDVKRHALTEFEISGIIFENKIPLRGNLDRIDFVTDSIVHVVDYKTGEPKSRNDIMGLTKKADASMWRQLVFYKYLLHRYDGGRMKMLTGEIDFVKPDDRGRFRREVFEISEKDTADLHQKISDVVHEIENFSFWDKKCQDRDCKWCSLRQ